MTFQIPWELLGQLPPNVSVAFNGKVIATQTVQLALGAPGIFTTNGYGTGQGVILDSSNRLVDSSNPATAGSTVIRIFCTGVGPVTNQPPDGAVAASNPLSTEILDLYLHFGSYAAYPQSAFLVPGMVGEYEVDVLVPSGVSKGPAVGLTLYSQGFPSNTATLAVQ
jgi:uncharacterized protein (TIGR03437 family)